MPRDPGSISVIIPTYNTASFLLDAIESALGQTHPPAEVIVIDDGSTDNTEALVTPLLKRVTYLRQNHRGVSAARNLGLQHADGEFIAFLDADDYFMPDKLASQAAILSRRKRVDLVHSGSRLVDVAGDPVGEERPWEVAPKLNLQSWLLWKPVYLGAMLFRRQPLIHSGGFSVGLKHAEDVDLILRLALAGAKAAWLRQATVCKRMNPEGVSRMGPAQAEAICEVLSRFFRQPNIPRAVRRLEARVWFYSLVWAAWQLYAKGYPTEAGDYLSQAVAASDAPPEQLTFRVLGEFHKHDKRSVTDPVDSNQVERIVRQSILSEQQLSPRIDAILHWWERVWQPFLRGDWPLALQGLDDFADLSPRQAAKLIQHGVFAISEPIESPGLDRLWGHFADKSSMPAAEQPHAVTIQLSLFTRSVLQGRPRAALHALARAARWGINRTALRAWGRFLRSGSVYLLAKLNGGSPQRQELIE